MLADVDSALRAWLSSALPGRTEIEFGSPADLGVPKPRRHPLVNLFLYAVAEDTSGLVAADIRLRDANGRISSAVLPTRRYALTYLVTAWAGDVLAEHQLLGAILVAHAGHEALDGEFRHGALGMVDTHIPIFIGSSRPPVVWDNLGLAMRTSLELTVIAPAFPIPITDFAPPAANLDLSVRAIPHETTAPPQPNRRWRRTSVTEP